MSFRLTRSADYRPPRERRLPVRYPDEDTKKRTARVAEQAIAQAPRPSKRAKPIQKFELPKSPDSVPFSFVATRRKLGEQVRKEFLESWEKAKGDPLRRNPRSRNTLIQPREFLEECRTFFLKGNPNPFGITVEQATNPAMGRGAFITNGAKKGEVLGYYPPKIEGYTGRNRSAYLFNFKTVPELDEFSLDGEGVTPEENFTPFINDIPAHTNVRFVPYYTEQGPMIVLVALRNFKKGERTELSASYGKDYWKAIGKTKQTVEETREERKVENTSPEIALETKNVRFGNWICVLS